MDFQDRYFGRGVPTPGGPPVANARLQEPPALAVLFAAAPDWNAETLARALREYHPDLAGVSVEFSRDAPVMGLVGWGRHVVKVAGFDAPMPAEALDVCVRPAWYDRQWKEQAYQHAAHARLFYAGYEPDALEQFVALTATAGALARLGALVVLNEPAHTSMPAAALLPDAEDEGDTLRTLREFPLPRLYAGFVTGEVEGTPGVWMRTHGCNAFKLPDLALLADTHQQTEEVFYLFADLLAHLRASGQSFEPGDTLNIGEGMFLRVREPARDEWFLGNASPLLVAERIKPEETSA
jgi:hypothetical protein